MLKIPYGISNFESLREDGFYFLDRTNFIERLENENRYFLFFLRPRRFGKSLFVSMLEHYYGIEHKEKFQDLFGGTYIGQHPTPKANTYLVLNFNFSGINTDKEAEIESAFNVKVFGSISVFIKKYQRILGFDEGDFSPEYSASRNLGRLFEKMEPLDVSPIYLLIDEYDHFTNELLSFNLNYFRKSVSSNGYIRKFYEVIKIGTGTGVVDRLFVTGVAPVTLDSLTSGFNIGSNISMELNYHDMMGMRHEEVADLLRGVGVLPENLSERLVDLTNWYNGYLFNDEIDYRLFNTNMVLYFASHFARYKKTPKELIDTNLATDYKKVGNLFALSPQATESVSVLEALIESRIIQSDLVAMFNFERDLERRDLVSLLYWLGFLTIEGISLHGYKLRIPNFVMEGLYRDFYVHELRKHNILHEPGHKIVDAIAAIATDANLQTFIDIVQEVIQSLSTRDQRHFNEMSLKAIFISLMFQQKFYLTRSEVEVSKPTGGKGYVDVYCQTLPNYETQYDAVFELKQAKTNDSRSLEEMLAEGRNQLKAYATDPVFVSKVRATAFFVVVCKGTEVVFERVDRW